MSKSEESDVENGEYEKDSSEEVMQATTSMVCFMLFVVVVLLHEHKISDSQ